MRPVPSLPAVSLPNLSVERSTINYQYTMNYELAYIIPLKYTEQEIHGIISKINEIIKKTKATVAKEENWGKRKIAYPIKQNRHGYFIITEFNIKPENLAGLNQELNNLPEVLRYSIVKFKPGAFKPNKKIKREEKINPLKKTQKELASSITPISKTSKAPSPVSHVQDPASPRQTKKSDKSKVALKDLDKKLDEILSDDSFNT